ncbi:MAG: cysteine synthase A [Brevinematales bacterium]|nr:cysteine synthase A [Brevinematales bacterium]
MKSNISNRTSIKSGTEVGNSILDLFFNTPIVKLNKLVDENMADVYVKLEFMSPGGSIKDRVAFGMIRDAENKGLLREDSVIIEPTSGNTGIAIALIASAKGYKSIIVIPETLCLERVYIIENYGAEVVVTPGELGMNGAIQKAKDLLIKIPNSIMLDQFSNPSNPKIHEETTASEIIESMGCNIDAFVAGVGTGGTITGVGKVLKRNCLNTLVVAVEPEGSPVISGGKPGFHRIQGIGAGFIPSILDLNVIDEIIKVSDMDAYKTTQALAVGEGIFAGISSGANVFASLKIAKRLGKGKKVLTILPDSGDRYFSLKQYFDF